MNSGTGETVVCQAIKSEARINRKMLVLLNTTLGLALSPGGVNAKLEGDEYGKTGTED